MKKVSFWLLAILGVAAFLRFHHLGVPAFRADTILLWTLAQRGVPPMDVLTRWFEVSGAAGQMPMPAFLMQAYLHLFHLPVTPFHVRTIFAVFGVLTVLVAYFAGRAINGPRFGLLFALAVALHPFAIQFSREAYFYSTALLGYFAILWAALRLDERLRTGESVRPADLGVLALGLFFSAYSQITGLIVCAVAGLHLAFVAWRSAPREVFRRNLLRIVAVYTVLMLPVVFSSWGLWPIIQQIGANREYAVSLTGELNPLVEIPKAMLQFSWGWTPVRSAWAVLAAALVLAGAVWRRDRRLIVLLVYDAAILIVFCLARAAAGAFYEARYLSVEFPFHLALMMCGLVVAPPILLGVRAGAWGARVAGLLGACAVAFWCYPAWLSTQLRGKPTPYRDIVSFADAKLPPGAPVLVDRWFEPWNELRAHPGTNVVFTFTVPNEPVDAYVQNNWRGTAQDFFRRFPEAAYLEIAKSYFDSPKVGPWSWPRRYFAQHTAFTNEAGLKLRELGLAARGDFYAANSNRVVVELFWNERDDVIAKAREEGRPVLAWFGSSWRYEKSGPMGIFRLQTQQFMDWRVMGASGEIELINLAGRPLPVRVVLIGASIGGPKQVRAGERGHAFQGGALETWDLGVLNLPADEMTLRLADVSGARFPLYVADLRVEVDAGRDVQ